MAILDQLDIFHGETTDPLARVYARLPRRDDRGGLRLRGKIVGPMSALGATLPATFRWRDLGPGPTILAGAEITDPCYWSPESPALYRADLELHDDGAVVETARREFGLRRLGVRDRSFRLNSKRWVLRGVRVAADEPIDWNRCRELAVTVVTDSPTDSLCREATEYGVLVVAETPRHDQEPLSAFLRRLARWAAVCLCVVDSAAAADDNLNGVVPNLLLGQRIDGTGTTRLKPWASVAVVDATDRGWLIEVARSTSAPLVAVRPSDLDAPLAARRAACDRLQSELASDDWLPGVDWAGFVV